MIRREDFFGPPMAAPETTAMRRLRLAFIVLAMMSVAGIATIGALSQLLGRAGAGGVLLAVIASTTVTAIVLYRIKTRRDDAWILSRGFDTDGGAA